MKPILFLLLATLTVRPYSKKYYSYIIHKTNEVQRITLPTGEITKRILLHLPES